jgi:ubiquinone/menaquinone biosynthesis C-methylase UbiE
MFFCTGIDDGCACVRLKNESVNHAKTRNFTEQFEDLWYIILIGSGGRSGPPYNPARFFDLAKNRVGLDSAELVAGRADPSIKKGTDNNMKANGKKPTAAGKSSYDLIDVNKFFNELNLQKGNSFLDLACGRGAYCLAASDIVGEKGRIYGVDLWEEGIELLKSAAAAKNSTNIDAIVSDAGKKFPVDEHTIDVCLMATVLHDFVDDKIDQKVLHETARVVKSNGILAIMEFKKIDGPPGPPRHIRLSPEQVDDLLIPFGFKQEHFADVGPYNYLLLYKKT